MEITKVYTDIEQSRILANILPMESADMTYRPMMDIESMSNSGFLNIPDCYPFSEFKDCNIKPLPCWSLSALLGVLPYKINLSHNVIDANGNLAYKNECYKFSINRCGLFGDKWNVQYYGKHQRQLGKRYKELYIDLFLSESYDNPVDACYEMIMRLNEFKMLGS